MKFVCFFFFNLKKKPVEKSWKLIFNNLLSGAGPPSPSGTCTGVVVVVVVVVVGAPTVTTAAMEKEKVSSLAANSLTVCAEPVDASSFR